MTTRGSRTAVVLTLGAFSCAVARVEGTQPPRASTGTYYVSPTGSDSNPGSKGAPFRTIQHAADLVNPGDVVIVEDGTYTDHDRNGAVLRVRRGGTPAERVVFRAANRWGARLDGENGTTRNGVAFDRDIGYVRVEGFEITGFANVGTPRGSASGIDLYDGGHETEIVGNHIHDIGRVCTTSLNTNGQVGIFIQQRNVVIEGNLIHDIGRFGPGENGCRYDRGFTGYRTLDHGIYLNGGRPGANGAIVRNNILHSMRHGWAIQLYPGELRDVHVLNNTFAFGNPYRDYTHIVIDASVSGSIVNNIFYEPRRGRTIDVEDFSGSLTVSHNITTGMVMLDRAWAPGGMKLANNAVATDPRLMDPPSDFRLQPASPAIDAGTSRAEVRVDVEGRARPHGAKPDIGAYEHH